jgi:outer membrane protein
MIAVCTIMLRRSGALLISFFIILTAFSAGSTEVLTWDDCVREAAKQNPDILAASSTLQSSGYKAKATYSGFWPQITGTLNTNTGSSSTLSAVSPAPGGSSSGSNNFYSAAVAVEQNIFKGFYDKGLVDQGAANKVVSSTALESTAVQVSFDLKSAFSALIYSQDYSKLADNIIARRQDNLNLVELRFEGGMENQGSVLLSKAFYGQAKYDKIQATHLIEVSRQQLAKVLGKDYSEDIRIAGKIPISRPEPNINFLEIALTTPEYRQAVAKERAAKAGVTMAKSQFSPSVNVFATASRQGNSWFPNGDKESLGLNASLPIFNGANNYFNFKSSQSDLATAKYNRESIEKKLLPILRKTYTAYLDAYEKLKVDRDFLGAATVRAEIARGKYNNGLLSFEDWDIIENDLITKQKTVILSERDLYLAEAAWQQAQGKGVVQL